MIDAKTPLDAYLAALETNDEKTRERQMVDHARQVRNHIRTVASKDYWKALRVTPDFVVMFVPGEAFFAAAIESDPNLFEQAVRQSVLISTPTTLIAFVKARDLREPWHVADGSRAARSPAIAGAFSRLLPRPLRDHPNPDSGEFRRACRALASAFGLLAATLILPTRSTGARAAGSMTNKGFVKARKEARARPRPAHCPSKMGEVGEPSTTSGVPYDHDRARGRAGPTGSETRCSLIAGQIGEEPDPQILIPA